MGVREDDETKPLLSNAISASLTWTNLSYSVTEINWFPKWESMRKWKLYEKSNKVILFPQSGQLRTGRLTAIIGKSGSGKSTLMESLTGRRSKGLSGQISIGVNSTVNRKHIKISFIPQNDVLVNTLTVYETLLFASKIRNRYFSVDKHKELIQELLLEIDLLSCKESYISKCSGGEKKRLSIALELVSKPSILLIDEPTSGLDANSAIKCVKLLKKLTESKSNPLAIFVSIHQPSALLLNEFHSLYVLSNNGNCMYNGHVAELLTFFEEFNVPCPQFHNPADHALAVASGYFGTNIIDSLVENQNQLSNTVSVIRCDDITVHPISSIIDGMSNHKGSFVYHCSTLIVRSLKTTFRDPMLNVIRFFGYIIVAALIVLVYGTESAKESGCLNSVKENANGTISLDQLEQIKKHLFHNITLIILLILFLMFASVMTMVLSLPMEISLLLREKRNGWYSCLSYYLAKLIADFPFLFAFTAIFSSIIYYLTRQINEHWRFGYFLGISFLISLFGQSLGMLQGIFFIENVRSAGFIAPLTIIPFVLFSGAFIHVRSIPSYLRILATISPLRYAYEALLITIYGFHRCDHSDNFHETIFGAIIKFFEFLSRLDISYSKIRPLLRLIAEDRNISVTEMISFDKHFGNITFSDISKLTVDESESLLLSENHLKNSYLWSNIIIMIITIVVLKVVNYFILLIKTKNRN